MLHAWHRLVDSALVPRLGDVADTARRVLLTSSGSAQRLALRLRADALSS